MSIRIWLSRQEGTRKENTINKNLTFQNFTCCQASSIVDRPRFDANPDLTFSQRRYRKYQLNFNLSDFYLFAKQAALWMSNVLKLIRI
jgi:hypothetical protein